MSQIGREAVAEIDSGGGHSAAPKPEALRDAGQRIEMRGKLRRQLFGEGRRLGAGFDRPRRPGEFGQAGKGSGGSAEGAGYVEQVAGAGTGAEQGFPSGECADKYDVGQGDGRLGEIAAGQRGLVGRGQGEQAVKEALEPNRAVAGSFSEFAR